jgi:hypothetical protein
MPHTYTKEEDVKKKPTFSYSTKKKWNTATAFARATSAYAHMTFKSSINQSLLCNPKQQRYIPPEPPPNPPALLLPPQPAMIRS